MKFYIPTRGEMGWIHLSSEGKELLRQAARIVAAPGMREIGPCGASLVSMPWPDGVGLFVMGEFPSNFGGAPKLTGGGACAPPGLT